MKTYNDNFTADIVKEHGEWCLARCLDPANAASERGRVVHTETRATIQRILAENEQRRG